VNPFRSTYGNFENLFCYYIWMLYAGK